MSCDTLPLPASPHCECGHPDFSHCLPSPPPSCAPLLLSSDREIRISYYERISHEQGRQLSQRLNRLPCQMSPPLPPLSLPFPRYDTTASPPPRSAMIHIDIPPSPTAPDQLLKNFLAQSRGLPPSPPSTDGSQMSVCCPFSPSTAVDIFPDATTYQPLNRTARRKRRPRMMSHMMNTRSKKDEIHFELDRTGKQAQKVNRVSLSEKPLRKKPWS